MAITLKINGKNTNVDAAEGTPLLWVLRDHLGLTGTKFGYLPLRHLCPHPRRHQGRRKIALIRVLGN